MCCVVRVAKTSNDFPKGTILVDTVPLRKDVLDSVFDYYGTTNEHPAQVGEKTYQPHALKFVRLQSGLNLSTGKYEGSAIFQESQSVYPISDAVSSVPWLPLLQTLFHEE